MPYPVGRTTPGSARHRRRWIAVALVALALATSDVSPSGPDGTAHLSIPNPSVANSRVPFTLLAPNTVHAQGRDPRFRPTLVDLEDVAQLRAHFQADDGVPRLLLVFSPT